MGIPWYETLNFLTGRNIGAFNRSMWGTRAKHNINAFRNSWSKRWADKFKRDLDSRFPKGGLKGAIDRAKTRGNRIIISKANRVATLARVPKSMRPVIVATALAVGKTTIQDVVETVGTTTGDKIIDEILGKQYGPMSPWERKKKREEVKRYIYKGYRYGRRNYYNA